RTVGQVLQGHEGSWIDGMDPRTGSYDCSLPGRAESVSMKWSGVLGAGTPPKSMGAGRVKSPCEW
ncbi:MAG: hypothetical protein AAGG56_03830, partial [Pseudomonadota bacterium]